MTADPPHVPRSPLKLPKLDGTSFLATPTQRPPNGGHKSAIERVAKTKTLNENPPPSAGKGQKVTAVAPPRRSLSLPASRPVDERVATRDPSPVRRGSLLRRRSGDFSLPVRYKYVVIPGNNSRAVLAAFRRRPWWGPARKEDNATAEAVVRSSNALSRKKSMKGARGGSGGGASAGYSNKTFNLWWEMYASRPVIEGTNLDANVRQAVNHFEFNAALVSKKGLWQSLRAYSASGGVSTLADVVPKTFYLSGGAFRHAGTPPMGAARVGDERAEFLSYCVAMDGTQTQNPSETTTNTEGRFCEGGVQPSSATPKTSTEGRFCEGAVVVPSCSETLQALSPTCPPWPLRPTTPNIGANSKILIGGDGVCKEEANGRGALPSGGAGFPSNQPHEDHKVAWEVGGRDVEVDIPGSAPGARQPLARGTDANANDSPVRSGPVPSELDGVRVATEVRPGGEETGGGITNQDGRRGSSAEGQGGGARESSSGIALGGAAGGTPTWVVKPAANSNCGFGIHICCSLKEVLGVVDSPDGKPGRSGWVVQRYIERPLLVRGRKFDIRLFVLVVADPSTRSWRRRSKSAAPESCAGGSRGSDHSVETRAVESGADSVRGNDHSAETEVVGVGAGSSGGNVEEIDSTDNGRGSAEARAIESVGGPPKADGKPRENSVSAGACPLTAWCHRDAYVRTSSVKYSNDPSKAKDRFVHLTNNAVQRRSPSYGQDEPGNKLSLADLQDWLDGDGSTHKGKAAGWVEQTLRPRMNALVAVSVAAAAHAGMNKRGRPYAFELLGYDFMVDDNLQVWLIEVNSNPCLEFVCPLLRGMIGRVIDDTLSVALDPVFRPPEKHRAPSTLGGGDIAGEGLPGFGYSKVYPAT